MNNKSYFYGIAISLFFHFLIVFLIFYKHLNSGEMGGYGGEVDEFESVMIVSNLPIGDLKEASVNSVLATQNYEAMPEYEEASVVDNVEALEDSTLSEMEFNSEIEIKKSKKTNKVIKNAPIKNKKITKKSEIKDENIKKKQIDKPVSMISGNFNQVAKDNYSSAPMNENGSKISSPSTGNSNSKKVSYQSLVFSHLNKFKNYPKNSILNKEEGMVIIRVKLDKDGNVLLADIKKSCNFESLNNAATQLFKKASPLPKPPENLIKNGVLVFSMPVEYDIKKYLKNR
ncbi:energy transducer TonB [Campylobacter sp. FMV-PI01]|uniref:Energy transducer TonB n=1 Tax=Campylobacter portucalensis TaxID=2608384 RepID=A0A6L5WM07_9BACT|nr:TonB family protein [Campylobacter portucalensis]MSN96853.1 energy transducer TonB [Campylobacter portucalensis]